MLITSTWLLIKFAIIVWCFPFFVFLCFFVPRAMSSTYWSSYVMICVVSVFNCTVFSGVCLVLSGAMPEIVTRIVVQVCAQPSILPSAPISAFVSLFFQICFLSFVCSSNQPRKTRMPRPGPQSGSQGSVPASALRCMSLPSLTPFPVSSAAPYWMKAKSLKKRRN